MVELAVQLLITAVRVHGRMYYAIVLILATVDFSVNDDANEFFEETYEGTLRRLFVLAAPSAPAVVVLNNVFYDTGKNAPDVS